jgi:WD40 repeat protein
VGAVTFSRDSKKLAVNSHVGKCPEVWNVQTQKLDIRVRELAESDCLCPPVLWTNKETILVVFSEDPAATIYEFDASTLETVGTPFKGHTETVRGLALSLDGALVASASDDNTIRLCAFESRQILASFKVQLEYPSSLILSPGSEELTYASGFDIYICNIPPDILTSLRSSTTGWSKVRLHPSPTFGVITFLRRLVQQPSIYWMYASHPSSCPC